MHVAFVAEKKEGRRGKYNTFRTCTVCRAVFSLQIANFIIGPVTSVSLSLSLLLSLSLSICSGTWHTYTAMNKVAALPEIPSRDHATRFNPLQQPRR